MNTREGVEEIVEEFDNKFYHDHEERGLTYLRNDVVGWLRNTLHQELQKARKEKKGWKGYLVVDPETDNYTYSDVYLNRTDAEKWLKANGISGLKIIEVDVYQSELDIPNN